MNYTKHNLGKIEDLFKEQDYTIRYEKGSFQSGYCIVENKRVIVVNKFFDTEARINTLLDLINIVEMDPEVFEEKQRKFYYGLKKVETKE